MLSFFFKPRTKSTNMNSVSLLLPEFSGANNDIAELISRHLLIELVIYMILDFQR